MFAVFGKVRAEEEKRRRLIYDAERWVWYEDPRKWKRLSNARYQISPEYSDITTAEEFVRLAKGNPDVHIVGIREQRQQNGKTVWQPVKPIKQMK